MVPNCNTNNCIPNTHATAAAVAKVLNAAKVPNVLWGWQAVSLLGVDYKYPSPNHTSKKASKALTAAGYTRCTDAICYSKPNDGHPHLAADEHFHSDAAHLHYNKDRRGTGFAGIRLYSKARLLWWIPDNRLETMEDRVVEALFMSTTDTSIPEPDDGTWASGTGRWHDIDPVEEIRTATRSAICGVGFSLNDCVVQEVEAKLAPEFRRVCEHDKKVRSEEDREMDENFYPILRLRERRLTGNLRQSTYHPPLPVENRVGRPQLPDLDVDSDYVVKRKRQG